MKDRETMAMTNSAIKEIRFFLIKSINIKAIEIIMHKIAVRLPENKQFKNPNTTIAQHIYFQQQESQKQYT